MSMDYMDWFSGTSDCCGARRTLDGLCSACREHCEEEDEVQEERADSLHDKRRDDKLTGDAVTFS